MFDIDSLKVATLMLAGAVEGAAALIIGLASIEATLRALLLFVPGRLTGGGVDPKEVVRLKLGRWLAVALEIELGADILRTAVAPTWSEIGQLGAIIVLRTALNFFPAARDRQGRAPKFKQHERFRFQSWGAEWQKPIMSMVASWPKPTGDRIFVGHQALRRFRVP